MRTPLSRNRFEQILKEKGFDTKMSAVDLLWWIIEVTNNKIGTSCTEEECHEVVDDIIEALKEYHDDDVEEDDFDLWL